MDGADCDRPLPNSAGDTFDQTESDVAGGKPRRTLVSSDWPRTSNVTRATSLSATLLGRPNSPRR